MTNFVAATGDALSWIAPCFIVLPPPWVSLNVVVPHDALYDTTFVPLPVLSASGSFVLGQLVTKVTIDCEMAAPEPAAPPPATAESNWSHVSPNAGVFADVGFDSCIRLAPSFAAGDSPAPLFA